MTLFRIFQPLTRRARRQAVAYKEVLLAFQSDPVAAYGLFHLLKDAGLLSRKQKIRLTPYLLNVENRLGLQPSELRIKLPMKFDPITDVEEDTLTFVIGRALRQLKSNVSKEDESILIAELRGLNGTLRRHSEQTASISQELDICNLLRTLLAGCARKLSYQRADKSFKVQAGDYFVVSNLKRSKTYFPALYLMERNLNVGDVVVLETPWGAGYSVARRISGESRYTKQWTVQRVNKAISRDNSIVIVYSKEGSFYRPTPQFLSPVSELANLVSIHDVDKSVDPTRYQPDILLTGDDDVGIIDQVPE